MDEHILDDIQCDFNVNAVMKQLRIKEGSPTSDDFKRFVGEAQSLAKPKAYYRMERVVLGGEGQVAINGITFTSRTVRSKLESSSRVFPCVATCGREMEEWFQSQEDILNRFWADALNAAALYGAMRALNRDVADRFQTDAASMMSPGSFPDWPIREQQHLFELLGDPSRTVGVTLSKSHLMSPMKSVSGIIYAAGDSLGE